MISKIGNEDGTVTVTGENKTINCKKIHTYYELKILTAENKHLYVYTFVQLIF